MCQEIIKCSFKYIVHPKKEYCVIILSFFLNLQNIQDFLKNVENQTVLVTFHWMEYSEIFLKIFYFMSQIIKEVIQVWCNTKVSKWWQHFLYLGEL